MSLTFIKFLILKEENTSLMFKFLQQHLVKVRTLRWAKLDETRKGSLKYRVQIPSDVVSESLHGVVELLTLSRRYALLTIFIKCSGN